MASTVDIYNKVVSYRISSKIIKQIRWKTPNKNLWIHVCKILVISLKVLVDLFS